MDTITNSMISGRRQPLMLLAQAHIAKKLCRGSVQREGMKERASASTVPTADNISRSREGRMNPSPSGHRLDERSEHLGI